MQSSPDIHLRNRCCSMSSTASEMKPTDSEEMALLHGSNRLSSPEQVRRRVSWKSCADESPRFSRQQSFGRDIGHAAAETYLVTRLSFNLLGYLGIYLMGQSAGAHISSCALIEQAIKEARGETISWSVSQIKAYFGLSGGYNLFNLVEHCHNRGLYRSIFLSIMEGKESLEKFSPGVRMRHPSVRKAASLLPHIVLFHGSVDYSIPPEASKTFAEAL